MSSLEFISKLHQHAFISPKLMWGSRCAIFRIRGLGDFNLRPSELGRSRQRLRGSTAKNIGRVRTCGQVVTSAANAADHVFISSEILGSLGRGRFSRLIVSVD